MLNKTKFPWPKLPLKLLFSKLKRYSPSQINNNNNTALFLSCLEKFISAHWAIFSLLVGPLGLITSRKNISSGPGTLKFLAQRQAATKKGRAEPPEKCRRSRQVSPRPAGRPRAAELDEAAKRPSPMRAEKTSHFGTNILKRKVAISPWF